MRAKSRGNERQMMEARKGGMEERERESEGCMGQQIRGSL